MRLFQSLFILLKQITYEPCRTINIEGCLMPVFKSYTQDGKVIDSVDEPLNEGNIDRFIAEYGEEKAKIYFEALADFTSQIHSMMFKDIGHNIIVGNTPQRMKTQIIEMYNHNKSLLGSNKVLELQSQTKSVGNSDTSVQP